MPSLPPLKALPPLPWIKTEIIAPSGKLGLYVGKIHDLIPPLLDIDVRRGVEVSAIDPALPLKDLVCLKDIICAVNGIDTRRFTKHRILKLFTNTSEGEQKIFLHGRHRVCEVRVRVGENLEHQIIHAIIPCVLPKKVCCK